MKRTSSCILMVVISYVLLINLAYGKSIKIISAGNTETIWEGINVSGKVCMSTGGDTVDYWFINSGSTTETESLNGERCIDIRKTIKQKLRVRNNSNHEIEITYWDEVTTGNPILGTINAVFDGIKKLFK